MDICRANENSASQIKAWASRERTGVHLIKNAYQGRNTRVNKQQTPGLFVIHVVGSAMQLGGTQPWGAAEPWLHRTHPAPRLLHISARSKQPMGPQSCQPSLSAETKHISSVSKRLLYSLHSYYLKSLCSCMQISFDLNSLAFPSLSSELFLDSFLLEELRLSCLTERLPSPISFL